MDECVALQIQRTTSATDQSLHTRVFMFGAGGGGGGAAAAAAAAAASQGMPMMTGKGTGTTGLPPMTGTGLPPMTGTGGDGTGSAAGAGAGAGSGGGRRMLSSQVRTHLRRLTGYHRTFIVDVVVLSELAVQRFHLWTHPFRCALDHKCGMSSTPITFLNWHIGTLAPLVLRGRWFDAGLGWRSSQRERYQARHQDAPMRERRRHEQTRQQTQSTST